MLNENSAWTLLPDTGAHVFLHKGFPLLIMAPPAGNLNAVSLEIEARHGWRVQVQALRNHDDPRGWLLAVEWCGQVAQPLSYDEMKQAPIYDHYAEPKDAELHKLTGMSGVSICRQLKEDWRGFPRGAWLVWCSHPPSVGIAYHVDGVHRIVDLFIEASSSGANMNLNHLVDRTTS